MRVMEMENKTNISDDVIEELRFLSKEDILLILSIGKTPSSNNRIEKTALLISDPLGIEIDAVPYKYGMFSETIYEKLHDESLWKFIRRQNGKSALTKEGQQAYDYLLEKLKANGKEEAIRLLEAINKLSDEDLVAISYHLFPESKLESEIKDRVERRIQELKKNSAVHAKVEDDRIVIEI
ncbi:MAG: hypothetical protein ABC588_00745 [Candidatus Methanosuratincola petrocarbonis]